MAEIKNVSTENIYRLDGRVPILKAIPFGLQHILAMFVSNLTPITIIGAASGLDNAQIAILLQNAMFIAGIATLIQLYPLWRIGSRLPIVMGVSFTFVTILSYVGSTYGYETMVGAVLVGGFVEGTLGLLAKYWKKIITPVVAASVVTAIGYSLFTVGTRSFGARLRRADSMATGSGALPSSLTAVLPRAAILATSAGAASICMQPPTRRARTWSRPRSCR